MYLPTSSALPLAGTCPQGCGAGSRASSRGKPGWNGGACLRPAPRGTAESLSLTFYGKENRRSSRRRATKRRMRKRRRRCGGRGGNAPVAPWDTKCHQRRRARCTCTLRPFPPASWFKSLFLCARVCGCACVFFFLCC